MRGYWLILPLVLASLGLVAPVRAQPSEAYARHIEQALAAYEAGVYANALEHFEAAHRIYPNARTLRGLGVVHFAEGRHVEAVEALQAALEHPVEALDTLRGSVEQLLADARSHVAIVRLLSLPEGATVALDGGDLPAPDKPVVVAPGNHVFLVQSPRHEPARVAVAVKAGEQRDVLLALKRRAPPSVSHAPPATPIRQVRRRAEPVSVAAPADAPPPRWNAWALAALGTGAGLLGASAAVWATARVRLNGVVRDCERSPCTGAQRDEKYDDANIGLMRGLAVGGAILGAVGVSGGLALGLAPRLTPTPPEPAGASVVLTAVF